MLTEDAVTGKSNREDSKVYASLLFFSLVIATPWFVWKLIKAMNNEQDNKEKWFEGNY